MSDVDDDTQNDSEGVKNLRKQFEALQKQLTERDERLAKYEAAERQSGVVNALKAKGLDEAKASKLVKFYSGDDASEEAVGKWLEENADVFGVNAQQTTQVSDPNAANAQKVSNAAFGSASLNDNPAGTPHVIGDPSEIQRLYQTASIEQLQASGMLPKNLQVGYGRLVSRFAYLH
jgi:hypothetical protein